MKNLRFPLMIFIIMICLIPRTGSAETGWVSDMLLLTFRQGPGNSYAITKTLQSNTPVSILDEKNGFYKVELQSNEIGWVDKKFIVFKTPKTLIINKLKKERTSLENKISKLESSVQTLKDKISTSKNDYSGKIGSLEVSLNKALDEKNKISNSLAEARAKYNTLIEQSKNIQAIVNKNKIFKKENLRYSRELEVLKEKNKDLFKTGMIKWFLSGVGVLLLGWIIGQSVSSKKRKSGSSLLN